MLLGNGGQGKDGDDGIVHTIECDQDGDVLYRSEADEWITIGRDAIAIGRRTLPGICSIRGGRSREREDDEEEIMARQQHGDVVI